MYPLRNEGSQTHFGTIQPGIPETPHLAVKISGDSGHQGEMEGCWKLKYYLKGPYTDLLAPRHSFQALVEGQQLRGAQRHGGRN